MMKPTQKKFNCKGATWMVALIAMLWLAVGCKEEPGPGGGTGNTPGATLLQPSGASTCSLLDTAYVLRQEAVQLDPSALANSRMQAIVLGDTIQLLVENRSSQLYYSSWYGHVLGDTSSYFMIVKRAETYSGSIAYENKSLSLKLCQPGAYAIVEYDAARFPTDEGPLPEATISDESYTPCNTFSVTDNYQIDILVLYTEQARAGAARDAGVAAGDITGAQLAIETEIAMAIEALNMSFARSKLPLRAELAGVQCIGVDGTWEAVGDFPEKLDRLRDDVAIRSLRNAYAADLVSLFLEQPGSQLVGRANYYEEGVQSSTLDAYSVVARAWATRNFVFAHEIGHNLGLHHHCQSENTAGVDHGMLYMNGIEPVQTLMGDAKLRRRLPYFTDVAAGCGNLNPLNSTPASTCQANEVSILPERGWRVSNYRCASLANDVWINDNFGDQGLEPNTTATSNKILASPNVWLRRDPDDALAHLYMHENPKKNGPSYLYVKLRNGSNRPRKGKLHAYAHTAGTSWRLTPDNHVGATSDSIVLPPQSSFVYRIDIPKSPGKHCSFAVEWCDAKDPRHSAACDNIFRCIKNNNNIAAKCVSNIYLHPGTVGGRLRNPGDATSHPSRETVEFWFEPIDNAWLYFLSGDSIKDFFKAGGKVEVSFEIKDIRLDTGIPIDTTLLPLEDRPSYRHYFGRNAEVNSPKWIEPSVNGKLHRCYIVIDASRVTVPGGYKLMVSESLNSEALGSYTFNIIVGDTPGDDADY